jgi:putative membrane protein
MHFNLLVLNYPNIYGTIKIIHIVAIVAWFAGLFYLPRLFIYHCKTSNTDSQQLFTIMEYKLFWYIMTPAAIITIICGELLAHLFLINGLWLHIKVTLVITLVIYHLYCWRLMKKLANGTNNKSVTWLKFFNEYPTIVLILCVILVVIQPHF